MAVDDVVERLVERRARRLARDVDRLGARLPTEALRDDLDPGAVVVPLPQRFALFLVGLEPDGAATAPELLPRVGEPPPATHVGDHDRLLEQIAQDGRDF